MNRYDTVNAFAAFAALHGKSSGPAKLGERLRKPGVRELVDVHEPYGSRYGRYPDRGDVLDHLEPDALAGYFGLVDRYIGRSELERLVDDWRRINSVDGVTIRVENSDDDPIRVDFTIRDPIAHEWAERHGSLDGGTWESCDGPDFVYDSTYWHPKLFDEIRSEGYDLDFSNYGEPDEHDLEVSAHAGECDECQYDWHKAEEHLAEELEETAVRKLARK